MPMDWSPSGGATGSVAWPPDTMGLAQTIPAYAAGQVSPGGQTAGGDGWGNLSGRDSGTPIDTSQTSDGAALDTLAAPADQGRRPWIL